ncbi:MAG: hypothetical protein LBL61_05615 [Elusimicrobiota bacterium]|jgi:hypothetical protein|nr:hypothetical protein [Elusimicrobiota bacterium]
MDRKITFNKVQKNAQSNFVAGSAEQLVSYVWDLTKEVCALGGKYDAERRLQRHIVRIERRKS